MAIGIIVATRREIQAMEWLFDDTVRNGSTTSAEEAGVLRVAEVPGSATGITSG